MITIELTDIQRRVLGELADCPIGRGLPVTAAVRQTVGELVAKGLAGTFAVRGQMAVAATDLGRAEHRESRRASHQRLDFETLLERAMQKSVITARLLERHEGMVRLYDVKRRREVLLPESSLKDLGTMEDFCRPLPSAWRADYAGTRRYEIPMLLEMEIDEQQLRTINRERSEHLERKAYAI